MNKNTEHPQLEEGIGYSSSASVKVAAIYALILFIYKMLNIFLRSIAITVLKNQGKTNKKYTEMLREATNDPEAEVKIITDADPNAFNAGDKTQFITSGMIHLLKNDKECIAVLLHEYGHFIGKHRTKRLTYDTFASVALLYSLSYFIYLNIGQIKNVRTIVLILSYFFGKHFVDIFYSVTTGKRHEYYADSYAKKLGYGKEMTNALKKLDKYVRRQICQGMSKKGCDRMMQDLHKLDEHPDFTDRITELMKFTLTKIRNSFGVTIKGVKVAILAVDKIQKSFNKLFKV